MYKNSLTASLPLTQSTSLFIDLIIEQDALYSLFSHHMRLRIRDLNSRPVLFGASLLHKPCLWSKEWLHSDKLQFSCRFGQYQPNRRSNTMCSAVL
jgi:hypothetical protein